VITGCFPCEADAKAEERAEHQAHKKRSKTKRLQYHTLDQRVSFAKGKETIIAVN